MKYQAIMLDLDQTLINTSELEDWRRELQWEECYHHFHLTSPYPYVHEFLKTLSMTKKLAVVTNSPYTYATRLLNYHNISYDHIIAYQKQGRNKPYPDQLVTCAKELGVKPEHCMYIGDDPNDIVAAKMAGFHAVGFCDNDRLEELICYMPDAIVSNFLDLINYVQLQDDPFVQRRVTELSKQARFAQENNQVDEYIRMLKEASKLGLGKAYYRLSKLIAKNDSLQERGENPDDYMREAAKRMVPEAIYEIGYGYELDGNVKIAEKYYRTAANLGLAHAKFHFGKVKLATMEPAKIKLSHRWIKKSVVSGLEKGLDLLHKVESIQTLEKALENHFNFDKETSTFYVEGYFPEKRYDHSFSQEILKVKDNEESAIFYFLEQLAGIEWGDVRFCYVPSSDKNKVDTGIRRIVQRFSSKENDATECLIRTESKEKSSLGGERSIEVHLNTMLVQDEEKIIGQHIVLFDDIVTSGSSLIACEQLLVSAGALHVTKLALGKTKRKGE